MKQYMKNVIIKKWLPLLEEYEKVKQKKSEHFRWVHDVIKAYHVTKKDTVTTPDIKRKIIG